MSENEGWLLKDKFESGFFWELYMDLERQFQDFLEYVPYLPENEKTYSFRLLNLILGIGGHIDSAFKEMARYPRFSEKEDCKKILKRASEQKGIISTGVDAFDDIYGISAKKVEFKRLIKRDKVTPFSRDEGERNIPEWWRFYNDLKHEVGFNIRKANLENARDALAGAFLLNVRHIPGAIRLFEYRVLDTGYIKYRVAYDTIIDDEALDKKTLQDILEQKEIESTLSVETPVFLYKYNQEYDQEEE